ncbi:MAG: hypothetical protein JNK46_13245 [Methylobacteriaceae bacterium]|nr:hypothetical protein [Methylobacteriaceae bacterium]
MNAAPVFGPYTIALTPDEFASWAQRVGERQRAQLARRFGWRATIFMTAATAAILAAFVATGALPARVAATAFAAMAAASIFVRLATRRQIARAQQAAIAGLRGERALWGGERRVTLDGAGIAVETGGTRAARPWSAFAEVERIGGVLAIWSGVADGLALPLAALGADAAAVEAFARAKSARH